MTPETEIEMLRRRNKLLEALLAGGTILDICNRLGLSKKGYYEELKMHDISHDVRHDGRLRGDVISLATLARRGFSSADIAPILQRSRLWVQNTAKEMDIKLPHGRVQTPSRRDLLAIVSGRTNEQVTRALDVSVSTLWAWMKAEGIDMKEREAFAKEYWGQEAVGAAPALPEPVAALMAPKPPASKVVCVNTRKMGCSPAAVAKYEARRYEN